MSLAGFPANQIPSIPPVWSEKDTRRLNWGSTVKHLCPSVWVISEAVREVWRGEVKEDEQLLLVHDLAPTWPRKLHDELYSKIMYVT